MPAGRPLKYGLYLMILKPDLVYSSGVIVRFAEAFGLLDHLEESKRKEARQKARVSLNHFPKKHGFPAGGDGKVRLSGQPVVMGWLGSRWQSAIHEEFKGDALKLIDQMVKGNPNRKRLLEAGYPSGVEAMS